MKKVFVTLLSALLVFGLVACGGSNNETADNDAGDGMNGTYIAQTSDTYAAENGNGFRDVLTVTYDNGKITSADFNSFDLESGTSKLDMDYPMDPPPSEWFAEIAGSIENNGKVDTVAGATSGSATAQMLLDAIEKDGVAGGTIEVDG